MPFSTKNSWFSNFKVQVQRTSEHLESLSGSETLGLISLFFYLPHNLNCKILVEWIELLSCLFVDSVNLCLWPPMNCYFIVFCSNVPWYIIISVTMVTIYIWDVSLPLFLSVEKEKRKIINLTSGSFSIIMFVYYSELCIFNQESTSWLQKLYAQAWLFFIKSANKKQMCKFYMWLPIVDLS